MMLLRLPLGCRLSWTTLLGTPLPTIAALAAAGKLTLAGGLTWVCWEAAHCRPADMDAHGSQKEAAAPVLLPCRADVGMTTPFMDAYVRLLIQTCHK